MRLITSRSLAETAEQFWVLRSLAERLVSPFAEGIRRHLTAREYEKLSPQILDDIGLPSRAASAVRTSGGPASETLVVLYRNPRAGGAASDGLERFDARVPFAARKPRQVSPVKPRLIAAGEPVGAAQLDARVPFARRRAPEPAGGRHEVAA